MRNKVITISREFGSGGRTIGRKVAEALQIPCYDQEIIEKIAEKSGFTKEFIQEKGEQAASGNWFANAFANRGTNGVSLQDRLWLIQGRAPLGVDHHRADSRRKFYHFQGGVPPQHDDP